jgi:hypothetical protein
MRTHYASFLEAGITEQDMKEIDSIPKTLQKPFSVSCATILLSLPGIARSNACVQRFMLCGSEELGFVNL